jgi:hypothetical protein
LEAKEKKEIKRERERGKRKNLITKANAFQKTKDFFDLMRLTIKKSKSNAKNRNSNLTQLVMRKETKLFAKYVKKKNEDTIIRLKERKRRKATKNDKNTTQKNGEKWAQKSYGI